MSESDPSPSSDNTPPPRYRRPWQITLSMAGLTLACCFFLPAIESCNQPIVPYKQCMEEFREMTQSYGGTVRETIDDLLGIYVIYILAYLIGVSCLLFALTVSFDYPTLAKRTVQAITAFLLFYVFLFFTAIGLDIYENGIDAVLGMISHWLVYVWFAATVIPVFIILLSRKFKTTYRGLNLMFVMSLSTLGWFLYWQITFWDKRLYIGLPLSLGSSLLMLIATVGWARSMTPYSLWKTVGLLAIGRFNYIPRGHCRHCGYNLTGLPQPRCPECGLGFEQLSSEKMSCFYRNHSIYYNIYYGDQLMTSLAKIFKNGASQAVRLPREFRFDEEEVCIKKIGSVVILFSKDKAWDIFAESVGSAEDDFLNERNQPTRPQKRKSL